MIDTKKIREQVDNSYLSPYLVAFIYKLCDEVDRLHEDKIHLTAQRDSFCRGNDEKIDEIKELKDQVRAQEDTIYTFAGRRMAHLYGIIAGKDKQIVDLMRKVDKAAPIPLRVGKIIDDQAKEIDILRKDLAAARNVNAHHQTQNGDLYKEVQRLEKQLGDRSHFCYDDLKARKELTKAIQGVLRKLYDGVTFMTSRELNDTLNKWGAE